MKKYHCYSAVFDEKTEKLFREAVFLGQGNNGVVYKLPEDKIIKLFAEKNVCKEEGDILCRTNGSKFFPKLHSRGDLYIVRDMVDGTQLDKYIKKQGLSREVSENIYYLLMEFKRLKFSKIDTRCKDIYVMNNKKVMLIDPKKCYTRKVSYPRHLMKGLLKLGVLDEFLYYISNISEKKSKEWGYKFNKYWDKEGKKEKYRYDNSI